MLLFSRSVMFDSLRPYRLQHARLPYPSLFPRVFSQSCPLSWWWHLTISFSVTPFSPCPQSFPASGSFPVCQLFTSSGQSIGASAQHQSFQWIFRVNFLAILIFLLSKGLSGVFSSTTVQKHQFFSVQPSLWSNSHIHTWLLEKIIALTRWTFINKWCLCFLKCCLGLL